MKTLIFLISFSLLGCTTYKSTLIKSGSRDELIKNAILDFSKTTQIYKKNTVFSIVNSDLNNDVIVLRIGVNSMNILFNKDSIGKISNTIPSRFFEEEGKLFFFGILITKWMKIRLLYFVNIIFYKTMKMELLLSLNLVSMMI